MTTRSATYAKERATQIERPAQEQLEATWLCVVQLQEAASFRDSSEAQYLVLPSAQVRVAQS
eukprot:m.64633 g.64633  ORF g.64633 m.64633 type:complete len:62 (+) comp12021_c0_seq1:196-381(+)